ncbi:stage II sporulation protein M [Oscillibacter sp.]|uniref:stage II sporulation protein M n=1 Tax=Oscillibacter sp. TaxID=1945593 RepID=UPI0026033024|nr:stage II sporulation protein M [Oscillibacter sp.]MDD3347538.1 stage II sporulation protein M [Oscillibacter sp.]
MTELFKQRYKDLFSAIWRQGFSYQVFRTAVSFLLLAALFFAASMALPELRDFLVHQVLETLGGIGAIDDTGAISPLILFSNNVQACAMIMLYGFIPFLRMPAMTLGVNAMMLGVLGAWYAQQGVSPLIYLALLLPHGVVELPALVLAIATGLFLCDQVTRMIRGREHTLSLSDCLLLLCRMLLLVLVPALSAAALLEAYVTPLLMSILL